MEIDARLAHDCRSAELPDAKRARFHADYGLAADDANLLTRPASWRIILKRSLARLATLNWQQIGLVAS
ncbi:hypothetical protein [Chromatium okenii]|uniref:hypothetical protein n=1 Tax=Chromatium okenii TaxID=61644 RepID=UPI003D6B9689